MLVYSILILINLFLHIFINNKRSIEIMYFVIGILLFLVSAIRYDVGTDYKHYGYIYLDIINGYNVYVEELYKYLNIIIFKIFGTNDVWLYIITSLIIIFCILKSIKDNTNNRYYFFSIFMFICSGMYFESFNLIRQYIAIGILALGITLLTQKKYIKYIFLMLVACLFHTSAFISILLVFTLILFRNKKFNKLVWIIYIVSLVCMVIDIRNIFNTIQNFIPQRWIWYLNSDFLLEKNYSAIIKQLFPNIILIFLLKKRKYLKEINEFNDVYILGFFVYVCLSNCFYGIIVLIRLADYFIIFLIFIIPLVVDSKPLKLERNCIIFLISIYYVTLTVVTIFIMNGHNVIPYITIFN